MIGRACLFCYCGHMRNMDFLEIQSLCGFDLQKAHDMANGIPPVAYPPDILEEEMDRVGLEKMEKPPVGMGG